MMVMTKQNLALTKAVNVVKNDAELLLSTLFLIRALSNQCSLMVAGEKHVMAKNLDTSTTAVGLD